MDNKEELKDTIKNDILGKEELRKRMIGELRHSIVKVINESAKRLDLRCSHHKNRNDNYGTGQRL